MYITKWGWKMFKIGIMKNKEIKWANWGKKIMREKINKVLKWSVLELAPEESRLPLDPHLPHANNGMFTSGLIDKQNKEISLACLWSIRFVSHAWILTSRSSFSKIKKKFFVRTHFLIFSFFVDNCCSKYFHDKL